METFLVIWTVLLFVVLFIMLMSRMNAIFSMLIVGVVGALVAGIVLGDTSFVGDAATGNAFIDTWQFAFADLTKSFAATGVTLVAVLGYVEYMNALKASDMFALTVSKVVVKIKNKTIIIIIALLLGSVIKWVVPSAVTAFLLLFATVYPVLRACGINRITAVCSLSISLIWSLGPGQPFTSMVYGTFAPDIPITGPDFFLNYELVYFIPVFIVCAVSFLLVSKFFEKKEEKQPIEYLTEDIVVDPDFDTSKLGIPGWYGLLPILPLVMVILFGGQVIPGLKMGVVPVYIFWGVLVCIIEFFRKGVKQAIADYQILLDGMGTCLARYASMVWAGQVFADIVAWLGGLDIIIKQFITADMSQTTLLVIGALACAILIGLTGQPSLAIFGLGAVIASAANMIGADLLYVFLPTAAVSTSTCILSVAAPVALVSAEKAGIPVTSFAFRQLIPCVLSTLAIIVCCAVIWMPA